MRVQNFICVTRVPITPHCIVPKQNILIGLLCTFRFSGFSMLSQIYSKDQKIFKILCSRCDFAQIEYPKGRITNKKYSFVLPICRWFSGIRPKNMILSGFRSKNFMQFEKQISKFARGPEVLSFPLTFQFNNSIPEIASKMYLVRFILENLFKPPTPPGVKVPPFLKLRTSMPRISLCYCCLQTMTCYLAVVKQFLIWS